MGGYFSFPVIPFYYDEGASSDSRPWAGPLVLGITGLLFMGIAVLLARLRREPGEAAARI